MKQVYGEKSHPYFIYSPRWIDSSAGIKALHYLCHALNSSGQKAYLVMVERSHEGSARINPDLLTPMLTQEVSDAYFKNNTTPIVVYSETVPGNPLAANCVIRYLMNFAGALGGQRVFDQHEYIVSFSKRIAEDYATQNSLPEPQVLFLPPIDPREFSRTSDKEPFQVVYAGKYRSFIGRPPKVGDLESIEIFRDGPRMQSREQVKDILRRATILYSFENSSIVSEAILSGTPAMFVPNEFLNKIIAEVELGDGGMVQGDSFLDLEEAQRSIAKGITQYNKKVDDFLFELMAFISATQRHAGFTALGNSINVPEHLDLVSHHRIGLAKQIFRHQGFKTLIRVSYHFALRRLSWRYWVGRKKI